MKLHSLEKPHTCSKCEYASTRFDKLKEHELKAHGIGTPPEKRLRVADMVLMHKLKELRTIVEKDETGQDEAGDTLVDEMGQTQELMEIQTDQFQDDSSVPVPVVHGASEMTVFDFVKGMAFGDSIVQEEMPDHLVTQGSGKPLELVPGQTIIIQQTSESGEVQEIALPVGGTQASTSGADAGQNFTEIMIPVEYMEKLAGQQVTFVTQK